MSQWFELCCPVSRRIADGVLLPGIQVVGLSLGQQRPQLPGVFVGDGNQCLVVAHARIPCRPRFSELPIHGLYSRVRDCGFLRGRSCWHSPTCFSIEGCLKLLLRHYGTSYRSLTGRSQYLYLAIAASPNWSRSSTLIFTLVHGTMRK